jgi:hypothetical protein
MKLQTAIKFSLFSILVLTGFTIYQLVDMSNQKYTITQMENENVVLEEGISDLRVDLSKNSTLNDVEEKIAEQGYEKISDIEYIIVSNSQIASR